MQKQTIQRSHFDSIRHSSVNDCDFSTRVRHMYFYVVVLQCICCAVQLTYFLLLIFLKTLNFVHNTHNTNFSTNSFQKALQFENGFLCVTIADFREAGGNCNTSAGRMLQSYFAANEACLIYMKFCWWLLDILKSNVSQKLNRLS